MGIRLTMSCTSMIQLNSKLFALIDWPRSLQVLGRIDMGDLWDQFNEPNTPQLIPRVYSIGSKLIISCPISFKVASAVNSMIRNQISFKFENIWLREIPLHPGCHPPSVVYMSIKGVIGSVSLPVSEAFRWFYDYYSVFEYGLASSKLAGTHGKMFRILPASSWSRAEALVMSIYSPYQLLNEMKLINYDTGPMAQYLCANVLHLLSKWVTVQWPLVAWTKGWGNTSWLNWVMNLYGTYTRIYLQLWWQSSCRHLASCHLHDSWRLSSWCSICLLVLLEYSYRGC